MEHSIDKSPCSGSILEDIKEKLYVVSVVFNPKEYKRRYELALKFINHITTFEVNLTIVECQIGQRPFHIPISEKSDYKVIRLRTNSELWIKENLINIGINSLPVEAKYVAWIDCDIEFENLNWVNQTIDALKENHFVQLFYTCSDLDPNKNILNIHQSFGFCLKNKTNPDYKGAVYHTGYGWAARTDTIRQIGGVFEYAVVGSSDRHMAYSFIGKAHCSYPENINNAYTEKVLAWSSEVYRIVQGKVGHIKGNIFHYWHGKKGNRKYRERWSIIKDNQFDPEKHVTKNDQGVLEWSELAGEKLKNEVSEYFGQRNEDSNEL